MPVFAYAYIDPLLDGPLPDDYDWGRPVDRVYLDWGDRVQWAQLLRDMDSSSTDGDALQDDKPGSTKEPCPDDAWLEDASLENARVEDIAGIPVCVLVRRLHDLGDTGAELGDRLQQLECRGVECMIQDWPQEGLDGGGDRSLSMAERIQRLEAVHADQRQRALQRGHAQNRLQAKPPPGKAPYGYRRGKDRYVVDRSTAPVVKDFFEHFLLYGSLRRSVRYLAQKYNKKISVSTGKRWLSNPVYRGHLAYKTGTTLTHTHAAILAPDEAAQVDRLLRRNRPLPPRAAGSARSLSGLVRCAHCQSPMTIVHATRRGSAKRGATKTGTTKTGTAKNEYRYLRPTQCKHRGGNGPSAVAPGLGENEDENGLSFQTPCPGLPYDAVLTQTIDAICDTLPRVLKAATLPDLDAIKHRIQTQIQEKQALIQQLAELQQQGILDLQTATLREYTLRGDVASLEQALAQVPPVNLQATIKTVSLRQFWLDLTEQERRFYLREFIRCIEIVRPSPNPKDWSLRLCLLLEHSSMQEPRR